MSAPEPQRVELAQELHELGEQIKKALLVARDHPKTKEVENQVTQALRDLSAEIERALKSEPVKQASDQVKQTAQTVKQSGAVEDIASGIAKGVRALNDQIRKAIEEAEKTQPKNEA